MVMPNPSHKKFICLGRVLIVGLFWLILHNQLCGMNSLEKPFSKPGALRFPKCERLCHATLITKLFEEGESVYAYPLRLTFRLVEEDAVPPELRGGRFQYMVNVPKKRFKRAVHRVRLRRLMREAWRLSRVPLRDRFLAEKPGMVLHMGAVYVGSEEAPFDKIAAKTEKLIAHLEKKIFPAPEGAESKEAEHEAG